MLYIIATPIGNLKDITLRALEILQACEKIFCEDTRTSSVLLTHHGIPTNKLSSYHKFNEKASIEKILSSLEENRDIALISDAGTPLISDPGHFLIEACRKRNIPYTSLPGPCSLINGLILSGFPPHPFQFLGFLPKKEGEKKKMLRRSLFYPGVSILFESPERIEKTLLLLQELSPERPIAITREMTKKFEEVLLDPPAALIHHFSRHPPRGEMILFISQGSFSDSCPVEEVIELLCHYHGYSVKEAIKLAAKITQKKKKDVYDLTHLKKEGKIS